MPASSRLKPQQKRSRESLARLMSATVKTLDLHGMEGATILRIARAAGLSAASVYRRFADKDALIRATLLAVLEQSATANRDALSPQAFAGLTLEQTVDRIAVLVVAQYRAHPGVLRALIHLLETRPNDAFARRAAPLIAANTQLLAGLLLVHRTRFAHPDPDVAARFAILQMVHLIEGHSLDPPIIWKQVLPLSDTQLLHEVTHAALGYLLRA